MDKPLEEVVERFRGNVLISSCIRGGVLSHLADHEWRALLRAAIDAYEQAANEPTA